MLPHSCNPEQQACLLKEVALVERNFDGKIITGIAEIDKLHYPIVYHLGSNPVYEAPPHVFQSKGKGNYTSLREAVEETNISACRHTTWLLVEWEQPETPVRGLLQQLMDKATNKKRFFCVGMCEGKDGDPSCILGILLKIERGHLTNNDLTLDGMPPTAVYKFGHGGTTNVNVINSVLANFGGAASECSANFIVHETGCFNMQQMIALTKGLPDAKFNILVGDAKLKQRTKEATDFQKALLTCLSSLNQFRCDRSLLSLGSNVAVAEWHHFETLDHECTRLDEVSGDVISIRLIDYVKRSELHLNHSLIILGGDHTTGWGKSQFAMRFVHSVAMAKSRSTGEDITPIFAKTLDILREAKAQLSVGSPILFDEVRFSDVIQVQYLSEDTLKALLDVRAGGQIHLRANDATFVPNQVRIWTSNAETLEDFMQGATRQVFQGISIPDTVRRRCWVCLVSKRLLKASAVQHLKQTSAANSSTYQQALRAFLPP